jgi:hypothetical protein
MVGLENLCLKFHESQQRLEDVIATRILEKFIEQEQRPSMNKEHVKEMQQPSLRRPKEEVDSSYSELGHGEWTYDPDLEILVEE